ncbi:MAG TPA: GGDEF domain-containing protein [Terracidiphilus sp.]|nr:GGDEF domain-containing protein [Terracidiphilus sp.]
MSAIHQERARNSLWAIAPAFLLLHGIVATCLPEWLDPLSTFCIVLAEWGAIVVCIRVTRRTDGPVRILWLLLVCAILFHSIAMSLDVVTEMTGTLTLNYVPRLQIFFSMLYGVPLLVAVSMQSDRRILVITRVIHTVLSIAVGAVLYLLIFSLLTVRGSTNPADAILIARLFDGIDVFLALAATVRWLGAHQLKERGFFQILSIFLWLNALLPAVHNRILIRHDYIWLDLFISAPYVVLAVLVLTARRRPAEPPSPVLVRAVQSGSPIFLAAALVCVGLIAARSHFYIGLAAALTAIMGYGTLNIFVHSRGLETEESLLASKKALEQLVEVDALTRIANRRAFDRMLDREFAAVRRTKLPMSLLMIDVDHFKQLNDAMGHLAGDDYLVRIAAALQLALPRATDFVARYGGEEFTAILPATDSAGAGRIAERVRQSIVNLGLHHPTAALGIVTVSVGFSTFDGSTAHLPVALTQTADRALYKAKCTGRNRSVFLAMEDAGD